MTNYQKLQSSLLSAQFLTAKMDLLRFLLKPNPNLNPRPEVADVLANDIMNGSPFFWARNILLASLAIFLESDLLPSDSKRYRPRFNTSLAEFLNL